MNGFARRGWAPSWLAVAVAVAVAALAAAAAPAAPFSESFGLDPWQNGWRTAGDASLFRWDAGRSALEVTWNSARSNSFCYRPLGVSLTRADDFAFSFSLRLTDLRVGTTPGKPLEFPIAIGLLQRTLLTNFNAFRGAGISATYGVRHLVEWDFYADAGFGDTWASTIVSSNNAFAFGHTFPLPLAVGDLYRVTLTFTASNQLLRTTAERNGVTIPDLEPVSLAGRSGFAFEVDAFSITSYSDAIQAGPPAFHGSVLAHGWVDDVQLTLPPPPVDQLACDRAIAGRVAVGCFARSNWLHQLERSVDLHAWHTASDWVAGGDRSLSFHDTNSPLAPGAFYRVRSRRP